jgi:hypothetical protein
MGKSKIHCKDFCKCHSVSLYYYNMLIHFKNLNIKRIHNEDRCEYKHIHTYINVHMELQEIKHTRLGMVVHVYNPSNYQGRDWEDCSLRPAQAKK